MRPVWSLIFTIFFLTPFSFTFAQVIVSEIMYDLSGADSDREWIEVQNIGSTPVDISGWKFREDDTNHSLKVFQGTTTLTSRAFAIIADNPTQFLADNPQFSQAVFDSTFSLSNTGEVLILKDSYLADIDSVSYASTQGGAGNGQSLQKVNGTFVSGKPTPGRENAASPAPLKEVSSPVKKTTVGTSKTSSTRKALLEKADETVIPLVSNVQEEKRNISKWFIFAGMLILVAGGGVLFIRRNGKTKTGFEIVE